MNDLHKKLKEKREELKKFRFAAAGSSIRSVKAGSAIKKDIARILTELNS